MLQAIIRTITELLDSKKAAYSFIAALGASVLHLYFGTSVQDALLLASPLGLATVSQAHVDASAAKNTKQAGATTTTTFTETVEPATPTATGPQARPAPLRPRLTGSTRVASCDAKDTHICQAWRVMSNHVFITEDNNLPRMDLGQ